MRFSSTATLISTAGALLAISSNPAAHHGAGADGPIWDYTHPFEVCGVVMKAEFINPHPEVRVSATDSKGNARIWTFAYSAANALVRQGVTRSVFQNLFVTGTRVLIQAFPDRRDPATGTAHTITFADGRTLTDTYFERMSISIPKSQLRCWT